ncbi:sterol desaturase family protein [Taibaiella chishuiensis]|uniref:Fatty acid hydroxylase family protein n=1 Tax=Taibaiella chishuiensis TaxID=1434707 RepID=A0A2P8D9Y5_9BACT|nr:sterol desaturase family protein [Taibaiella chishuiensis]PSK94029.1 fatty acid hydroxylase family protein [Taibaiella chishuiensis]
MDFDKIKNKGQGRLFQSDYIEMMTKTHPAVIYSIYFPVIAFLLYYGYTYHGLSAGREALLFFSGVLFWSFFEYIMHRFVFHFASENQRMKNIIYTMHGVHHEYPRDRERLFMPPLPSIVLATIFFSLQYLLMGWNALGFFPGFMFGYLLYGSMHYAIHAFTPPSFLKALWRNHHLHHYKYPEKGFGVSSVLWDHVFGTVPPKK